MTQQTQNYGVGPVQGYDQNSNGSYGYQPEPNYGPEYGSVRPATGGKDKLRLVAFIFDLLTIIGIGICVLIVLAGLFLIPMFGTSASGADVAMFGGIVGSMGLMVAIPLAWCIPLTVMCWKTYKGERSNSIALGILTLLLVNLISGILLLVSDKN